MIGEDGTLGMFRLPPDQRMMCSCGWSGTASECNEKWVFSSPEEWVSLCGREGWDYICPKCGHIITSVIVKIS